MDGVTLLTNLSGGSSYGGGRGIYSKVRLVFKVLGHRIPVKLWQRYQTIETTYNPFNYTDVWSSAETLLVDQNVELTIEPPSDFSSKTLRKLMVRAAWLPKPDALEDDGN